MKTKYKYNKLFGRLAEMGLTREDYAKAIGTQVIFSCKTQLAKRFYAS